MTAAYEQLAEHLPAHLAERTRCVEHRAKLPNGEFVLYWLHHAMRAHENPALDVSLSISNQLGIPLLVYQAIPEHGEFASDRHHAFVLQGARDLQEQFCDREIQYAFHLQRQGHRDPYLRALGDRAVVVVTEEMPVDPVRSWTDKLASTCDAPTLCVDTACVVPMRLVGKAYERAFQFRKATRSLYDERVGRKWIDIQPVQKQSTLDLPFNPLSLSQGNLASLIAECEIDHCVAPVPHTRGGSAAGYSRWNAFKQRRLDDYARQRNNPLIDGTSRLSPYLHYGMVSPLRIAREAAEAHSEGADKFLDELLIWRELAYVFCFVRPDHASLTAIPDWARESLAGAESDTRLALHSWETLARGKTGDKLWDAAQKSLLMHGELHNNVRMTWGKALLRWTPDADTALKMMTDLNHRYALDGRDPASYGGILWCLGQLDRPFPPSRPILGNIRDRSTSEHSKRLDVDRYLEHTMRPLVSKNKSARVAIVGAGISGLMCGRVLTDHGVDVTIFEKGRGVGGRMATRRTSEGLRFDHGAQYFTVRDERFERYVKSWALDGIVAPWHGRICTLTNGQVEWKEETTMRFVGVPGMSAICRHLAEDLDIEFNAAVQPPEPGDRQWKLYGNDSRALGQFDYFLTSAPAPQSAELLRAAPHVSQTAESVEMNGCWAVLLAFDKRPDIPLDGAFVHDSPLSWIARNNTKPERDTDKECWVLHASPDWTTKHLEAAALEVQQQLVDAFWEATGAAPVTPSYSTAHRWRCAIPPEPIECRSLFDEDLRVGACGDWCSGPRVEGAFLSGASLAGKVLSRLLSETEPADW